jgi:hypothetical protein
MDHIETDTPEIILTGEQLEAVKQDVETVGFTQPTDEVETMTDSLAIS